MKLLSILTSIGVLFSSAVLAQGFNPSSPDTTQSAPGLNTVPYFGSTAIANQKHGYTHYRNHNSYSHWIRPGYEMTGASCCNGSNEASNGTGDCDIVRTYTDPDDETRHYIMYDGRKLWLPENKRVMVKGTKNYLPSPDGNSHACISEYTKGKPEVLCWVLGDGMN